MAPAQTAPTQFEIADELSLPWSIPAGSATAFVDTATSLRAVVAGDTVFDHVYFGVPKDKAREDWMKTLDQITALNPVLIVPGHQGPGATQNMASIAWVKKYIADWDANIVASKSSAAMRAKVVKQYPGLGTEFTLNDRITAFFPAK
jgi:hypothetical protein